METETEIDIPDTVIYTIPDTADPQDDGVVEDEPDSSDGDTQHAPGESSHKVSEYTRR